MGKVRGMLSSLLKTMKNNKPKPSADAEPSEDADLMFEYTGAGCCVPKDVTSVLFNEGLQKIGYEAFYNCSSLESITIPSTVTEIGADAFRSCTNLNKVVFNEGLQKIGFCAFYECTSLQSITLPSTVTEIGENAFKHCCNLEEVTFNNGLQKMIEEGAFYICDALERFLFPTISCRLEDIIQTSHWGELENKLSEVRGVVQWESNKLFVSTLTTHQNVLQWERGKLVVSRATHHNWNDVRRDLGKITRLVSYYELKEATTTFELALWKFKLDQAGVTNTANRADYRIDVPGPVKDTMLQYLDHT